MQNQNITKCVKKRKRENDDRLSKFDVLSVSFSRKSRTTSVITKNYSMYLFKYSHPSQSNWLSKRIKEEHISLFPQADLIILLEVIAIECFLQAVLDTNIKLIYVHLQCKLFSRLTSVSSSLHYQIVTTGFISLRLNFFVLQFGGEPFLDSEASWRSSDFF